MQIELDFGMNKLPLFLPDSNLGNMIRAKAFETHLSEKEILEHSIDNPIQSNQLREIISPGDRVVIITSDVTRPIPSYKILPILVDRLNQLGVNDRNIIVVFGMGSHRKHRAEEQIGLIGSALHSRILCMDSDPDNVVHLGSTSNGTPVDIFKPVAEADKIICLGNIEYHYFAGYSGGYKAIMPGVSTFAAIQKNHSLMVKLDAVAGKLRGNPVRDDIDEIRKFITIDFLINVILDEHKRIIACFAGDPIKAHEEGCRFLDTINMVPLREKADIVVVSPGGYPKDINLYQAQKALDNAKHAVKEGGIIILVAECSEGLGGEVFEEWMLKYRNPHDMILEIQRNFILGGHKAAAIALILETTKIFLVSKMPDDFVKNISMHPFHSAQDALDEAIKEKGPSAIIHVIPYGGSCLPRVEKHLSPAKE